MPVAQQVAAVDARLGPEVVLIPVKAFHQAKRRLGSALSDPERIRLVRSMASQVVAACTPLPVAVVCDDDGRGALGVALRRHRDVGARTGPQRRRVGRGSSGWPVRASSGSRSPTGICPRPRAGRAPPVRGRNPGSRPARTTAPTCCASPWHATSAHVRTRVVPVAPRRGRRGSGCPSGCYGNRPWPTTSIGRPTSESSASRRNRCPVNGAGGPKAPVPRVPAGTKRLAPLPGGGSAACGLLGRSPTLGRLAEPEPASWRPCAPGAPLLGRSPLLGGLTRPGGPASPPSSQEPASWRPSAPEAPLGRLLGRSPLLCGLPCRSPLHGLPCRSPLDGLLGRGALNCLFCGGPLRGLLGRGPFFLRLLPQVRLPRSMVTE